MWNLISLVVVGEPDLAHLWWRPSPQVFVGGIGAAGRVGREQTLHSQHCVLVAGAEAGALGVAMSGGEKEADNPWCRGNVRF